MSLAVAQALALRRAVVCAAALAATLGAHAVSTGSLAMAPGAPVAWGWLVAVVALVGPRRASWRARGVTASLVVLLAGQTLMHAGMTYAPWAFGLQVHHRAALVTPAALVAHAAAAVVLAVAVARAERLLSAALGLTKAMDRLARLAWRPRRAGVPTCRKPARPALSRVVRPAAPRGPPRLIAA